MKNLRIISMSGPRTGAASYRDDGEHNGNKLLQCPFCGGDELEIHNTHTAAYWVECECDVQKFGESFVDEADMAATEAQLIAAHEKAFQSAVDSWNERATQN